MPDPAEVMSRVRKITDSIVKSLQRRDAGKFSSIGDALDLQKLQRLRKTTRAELPPLALVN